MEDAERQRYRSSFGAAAVAYAEHRPDYAEAGRQRLALVRYGRCGA